MSHPVDALAAALRDRYTIDRELGAGGMATVYLAEDLKHRRQVAVKVLRPELAAIVGAERFLNEIEVTANLQHPNILPLYDSGQANEFLYYVMPFIEGESLRDKLNREKQLSVDEAIEIAKSVAAALSFAHARSVVHRDIKPENILLQAGQALVADFGIALAVSHAGGTRLTETGLSLGTPHYMSPEQATGDRDLDARSDVYSLGAVVYEMLTGDPPHQGNTVQAIIAKILSERPTPIGQFRDMIPLNVQHAVERALAKSAADRFGGAAQFADALTNPAFTLPGRQAVAAPTTSMGFRWAWLVVTFGAGALAAWGLTRAPASSGPVARVQIVLTGDQPLTFGRGGDGAFLLAISRDGSRIAYVSDRSATQVLVVRDLDSIHGRVLAGTEGARQPFFSPDGEWIAFFAGDQLHRVAVRGGAPIAVADLPPARSSGGSWSDDDTIVFAAGDTLYRVPVAGGTPTAFPFAAGMGVAGDGTTSWPDSGQVEPRWPQHLPRGRLVLVTVGNQGTGVFDLETTTLRYVFAGLQARYLPTGHVMFNAGQERVRVAPFDLARLAVTGPEVSALENVFRGPGGGAVNAVVSETGTLVYVQGGFERSLVFVDRDGRETPVGVEPRGYRLPQISPDKRWLAVTVDPRPSDLWIIDLLRATAVPRPTDIHDGWGVWSPDGREVAIGSGSGDLVVRLPFPFTGDPDTIVPKREFAQYPVSWTHDDHLLTTESGSDLGNNIGLVSLADGSFELFLATEADELYPRLSPDGRWVAYASNETGQFEVYVLAYPDRGLRHAVSIGGGTDPVWSDGGTELFYRSGNTIMAVDVQTTPTFAVTGTPTALFSRTYAFSQSRNWVMGPDGRFVFVKGDPTTTRQLQVVFNWFAELEAY